MIDGILSGNCIALYGERRIGKSLCLEMIKNIINDCINNQGKLDETDFKLIDQNFIGHLPTWKAKLVNYKALYISLMGNRTERSLSRKILDDIQEQLNFVLPDSFLSEMNLRLPLSTSDQTEPEANLLHLSGFGSHLDFILDKFQSIFKDNNEKLVILLDEMEILEIFENGDTIAELLCDRSRYSNIIFIHAGSHDWHKNVSTPGSLFTHLEPYYLREIDKDDTIRFLLSPLPDIRAREFIYSISGGKPLLIQYIGRDWLSKFEGKLNDFETQFIIDSLLENESLKARISQSIYEERRIDEQSKRVLAALAYHRGAKSSWLASKLKINLKALDLILSKLICFGTIINFRHGYSIKGELIEFYGREVCGDPTEENYLAPPENLWIKVFPRLRWAGAVMAFISIGLSHIYCNPEQINYSIDLPNLKISLVHPKSLETSERGEIILSLENIKSNFIKEIDLFFNSQEIRYAMQGSDDNSFNTNLISIDEIKPYQAITYPVSYVVLPGNNSILTSKIIYEGNEYPFNISRRKFPIKQYSIYLNTSLSALGILLPGKQWTALLLTFRTLLGGQGDQPSKDKSNSDTEKNS